ncbi:histidinol dehydrogenase [Cellulosilyticum lentocellum]|uniref:Histidinol dehydrogenase n=1 Tax=Cellulosilyticum lentocellum (strain ATCC 49066 / DSM 5427 / NCIMB 11756 / RHM5) TaxID=642492 RepID=F2JGV3_CELLD|nr:histidinol dehydrogenase [Cellulosilyticum lentocellum]ADZ84195.1 histidinol dehydrogenase [Cellulosilyticum lentocellum DSM 5427]
MIQIIETIEAKEAFLKKLEVRGNMDTGEYALAAKKIVDRVRSEKDAALFEYTAMWDCPEIHAGNVKVSVEDMKAAYDTLEPELQEAITLSAARIESFHQKQKQNTWIDVKENGEILGQRVTPLEKVGVYVPGGKAAYPSSVLMNVIPAKVAGVERIVMVTPASKDGQLTKEVLAAAYIAGVTEVYKIGGAQAIAALAFGTETIPKVDKIVGPGNIYVTLAKREVFGYVNIDSIAGPSEILIVADESANPTFVAADLLSQAEHDQLASAVLITTSKALAEKVQKEVARFYEIMPRQEILSASLANYCAIVIEPSMESACELANAIAPEHLELAVTAPFEVLTRIKNAGAIFLGHYTPEPVGDYMAGPNHVLPTNGTARFFSPLGVDDFIKKSSILSFTKEALMPIGKSIVRFAESERLFAHALSVQVRLDEEVK